MEEDPDDRPGMSADEVRERVRGWFERGRDAGERYMIVAQDMFDYWRPDPDYGYYPRYARTEEERGRILDELTEHDENPVSDRFVMSFDLQLEFDGQMRDPF